jgi:hypothetical protein
MLFHLFDLKIPLTGCVNHFSSYLIIRLCYDLFLKFFRRFSLRCLVYLKVMFLGPLLVNVLINGLCDKITYCNFLLCANIGYPRKLSSSYSPP